MKTISVSIPRPPDELYEYLSNPAHLPQWSDFITAVRQEGETWYATTPQGEVRITFAPPNPFWILDHTVEVSPEVSVNVPMRVVRNGDGSEVLFTVFRLEGMSDNDFEKDVDLVRKDLMKLRGIFS